MINRPKYGNGEKPLFFVKNQGIFAYQVKQIFRFRVVGGRSRDSEIWAIIALSQPFKEWSAVFYISR